MSAPNAFGVPEMPYSSSRDAEFVNSKSWGCLHQLCAFGQMLCKFRIIIQPPKCVGRENEIRRAAAVQLLKIGNRLLAVARIAGVDGVFLEEVPTLSLRVLKYRRITRVPGNNQRIGRRNSVQLETGITKLSGGRFIEWSHVNVSHQCKRTRKQYRQCSCRKQSCLRGLSLWQSRRSRQDCLLHGKRGDFWP